MTLTLDGPFVHGRRVVVQYAEPAISGFAQFRDFPGNAVACFDNLAAVNDMPGPLMGATTTQRSTRRRNWSGHSLIPAVPRLPIRTLQSGVPMKVATENGKRT